MYFIMYTYNAGEMIGPNQLISVVSAIVFECDMCGL